MRPEKLFLVDIVEAADAIQRFIDPVTQEAFLRDELRQSGVLQKHILIGEAAARLPKSFQTQYCFYLQSLILNLQTSNINIVQKRTNPSLIHH